MTTSAGHQLHRVGKGGRGEERGEGGERRGERRGEGRGEGRGRGGEERELGKGERGKGNEKKVYHSLYP